jgi:hypothetical protein
MCRGGRSLAGSPVARVDRVEWLSTVSGLGETTVPVFWEVGKEG